jgi:hypothetical protein
MEYLLTQIHLTLLPWEAQEVQAKAWIDAENGQSIAISAAIVTTQFSLT